MSAASEESPVIKPANKRGVARLGAVQAIYQMEIGGASLTEIVSEFEHTRLGKMLDGYEYLEADLGYFRGIVAGVVKDQRQLDPMINKVLTPDWPLSRIDLTLRAVLRCGAFELNRRKDVPARVIINEYVDVAKAFFEVDEPRMVNGVLNRLARDLRQNEFPDAVED